MGPSSPRTHPGKQERDFQFLFFFRNHGGGWPHRQRRRGVRHELSWGGNSDATPLSVGEWMCLCLIRVASGVACLPTTVGVYAVGHVISRPRRAGRESIFWFLTKCVVTVLISLSSRIGEPCVPHDDGGVRCWARHPPTPPRRCLFSVLAYFFGQNVFVTAPAGADAAGHHVLSWVGESGATRLFVGGWLLYPLYRVASEVVRDPHDGRRVAVMWL